MRSQACSLLVHAADDQAYVLRQGVWTDSADADEETLDIVAWSDAYFALIERLPGPHRTSLSGQR